MPLTKPRMEDKKIRQILSLLGENIWDDIVSAASCSRPTISKVNKWYNSLSWSEAKIYADGDEAILKVRKDHLKMKTEDMEASARTEQEATKEVVAAIASNFWELVESGLPKLIQDGIKETMGQSVKAEMYDTNYVAASKKRIFAEVMHEKLAVVASDGIYSLTAIQVRLLKSTPEQLIECLRESLGGIELTPAEEETLARVLTDGGLAEKLRKIIEAIYRRIKALERYHNPLTTSDAMLIWAAIEMDDDQFNKVLKLTSYNEDPDHNADVVSAAAKLLIGVGEQLVLMDEVEKDSRTVSTKEVATNTAQGRMELAKLVAVSWFSPFVKALALKMVANADFIPWSQ